MPDQLWNVLWKYQMWYCGRSDGVRCIRVGLSEEATSTQRGEDGKESAMQRTEKGTFQGEGTLQFKRKKKPT